MLLRWATIEDKPAWLALSREYDKYISKLTSDMALWYKGFDDYMDAKIRQNNAVIAVDRMTGKCNGMIAFSKSHNRITFFAISERAKFKETAEKLLLVSLRQLDTHKDITVLLPIGVNEVFKQAITIFSSHGFTVSGAENKAGVKVHNLIRIATSERRGGSFHYNYDGYFKMSKKENCPPCLNLPMPDGHIDIAELEYSFATAEKTAQGRLFGKCHVLIKNHYNDFEDIPHDEMVGFMSDIQKVGKALHKVTGAIKINYELHANSGPHIHCHLFPRYLDDDFPSAPIDYRITEPSPYESVDEYLWFIEQMRKELNI
ncbi:MAG: hypothetical protein CVU97_01320 [Firmicutes bacterium HGW-Firmicutes-21]|nr:MAG: hypothetical protein CVU97_01320 [Firmicutes bacterium HGW-Firmicutes-21]